MAHVWVYPKMRNTWEYPNTWLFLRGTSSIKPSDPVGVPCSQTPKAQWLPLPFRKAWHGLHGMADHYPNRDTQMDH